jgi:tRNA A37 N6-isopentenylltransferase MiaA
MDGKTDLESAKEECLTHNNQLARRQLIWFKTNSAINWFEFDRYSGDQLSQSVLNIISQKR